jgi:hypothetical protein
MISLPDLGTTYIAIFSYDVSNSFMLAFGTTTYTVVM